MTSFIRKPKTAILLAAGYGKRLLPHTRTTPKALINVEGIPVVNRTINALKKAGINRIVVVIGHLGEKLKNHLSNNFSSQFEFKFVVQMEIIGTADALAYSSKFFSSKKEEYILVLASDYLLPENYINELIDFHISNLHDISVSLRPISLDRIKECSYVDFGIGHEIHYIHEKPNEVPHGIIPLSVSLICILPVKIFQFLDAPPISKRNEKELFQVINQMISHGWIACGLIQDEIRDWEKAYRGGDEK